MTLAEISVRADQFAVTHQSPFLKSIDKSLDYPIDTFISRNNQIDDSVLAIMADFNVNQVLQSIKEELWAGEGDISNYSHGESDWKTNQARVNLGLELQSNLISYPNAVTHLYKDKVYGVFLSKKPLKVAIAVRREFPEEFNKSLIVKLEELMFIPSDISDHRTFGGIKTGLRSTTGVLKQFYELNPHSPEAKDEFFYTISNLVTRMKQYNLNPESLRSAALESLNQFPHNLSVNGRLTLPELTSWIDELEGRSRPIKFFHQISARLNAEI